MQHIEGSDRDQLTLFPEALDDYIAQDNPVRFLDAFIDALDLAALAFPHHAPKDTRHPPYATTEQLSARWAANSPSSAASSISSAASWWRSRRNIGTMSTGANSRPRMAKAAPSPPRSSSANL